MNPLQMSKVMYYTWVIIYLNYKTEYWCLILMRKIIKVKACKYNEPGQAPHLFTLTPCLTLANDPMKKVLVVSVQPLVVYGTYCITCWWVLQGYFSFTDSSLL